jgi:hypothetical protein
MPFSVRTLEGSPAWRRRTDFAAEQERDGFWYYRNHGFNKSKCTKSNLGITEFFKIGRTDDRDDLHTIREDCDRKKNFNIKIRFRSTSY